MTGPRLNGCDNKSLRTKKLLPTEKLAFPAGVFDGKSCADSMMKVAKAYVLLFGPNRTEVVSKLEIRIPENLNREQRSVLHVNDENLPSSRIIFIKSVERIFSSEVKLL